MIFASKAFYLFLFIVLGLYYLLPGRVKQYRVLLVASWVFYGWLSPQYLWVIWLLTLIDYLAAIRIEKAATEVARRSWLVLSIASNLGLLFSFKYTAFAYDTALSLCGWMGYEYAPRTWEILLPLGISFHTFQGISYTVDVYRRQIRAVPGLVDYALFVAFFPQLAAGPIVRAVEFLPQMETPPTATSRQIGDGIWLFCSGLFKKLVIADNLDSLLVSAVFENPSNYSNDLQRWAVLAWAVQIYCDFSGYTDMARGCAKWFGFELPENFRLPYLATNITDFWRRWHLSLSTWLRDYLYFPLGGSQRGPTRTYFNLMMLFVLCGLWHGAAWNWLAYGVFNGLLMGLHRAYDRALTGIKWADTVRSSWPWLLFAWCATAVQFLFGLILIRMTNWDNGLCMMASCVQFDPSSIFNSNIPANVILIMILGMVGHLFGLLQLLVQYNIAKVTERLRLPVAAALLVGVMVFSPGVTKTFIYIQF